MAVASDLGRYFLTFSLVSIGQVAKLPCSMALMKVEVAGLKQAWWRNLTVSAMVPAGRMLLACPGSFWLFVVSLSVPLSDTTNNQNEPGHANSILPA